MQGKPQDQMRLWQINLELSVLLKEAFGTCEKRFAEFFLPFEFIGISRHCFKSFFCTAVFTYHLLEFCFVATFPAFFVTLSRLFLIHYSYTEQHF